MTTTYSVALLGDAKVGKTSFIYKHLTGDFISEYTPTTACHKTTLPFTTNHGFIDLEVLDIPGVELTASSSTEALKDVDAAIILFDLSRRETYQNTTRWYDRILSANRNPIPIVICGTKADIPEEERDLAPDESIWSTAPMKLESFAVSIRDVSVNFELPFLSILQKIYNDTEMHFAPAHCCFPRLGQTMIDSDELELEDAAAMSLVFAFGG